MFKAIILLKRRDDTSLEEFTHWWLGAHAPLAKGLPGLIVMLSRLATLK